MGFEFERVNGDGQDPKDFASKFLQDANNLLGRAKKEVQQTFDTPENRNRAKNLGDQITAQAQELGRQGQQMGESIKREIDKIPPEDRQKMLDAGKDLATGMAGGAPGLLMNKGFAGKLGDLFGKGNQAVTKLNTEEFVAFVRENFSKLDKNGDGFIAPEEAKETGKDVIFKVQNAFALDFLEKKNEQLRNCKNDEWFSESKGVSLADINALDNARQKGTGFGAYAGATWDGITSSPTTAVLSSAAGYGIARTATEFSHLKSATVGVAATAVVLGAYGALDYATSRKSNLETVLKDLG